jgi:hypothetical protein
MSRGWWWSAPLFLALSLVFGCLGAPGSYRAPIATRGSTRPSPVTGGASGVGGAAAGADCNDGGTCAGDPRAADGEPIPPCTALAECCASFDATDPAQGECEEALFSPTQEGCENALRAFVCQR